MRAFDFLDVVNHVLFQYSKERYQNRYGYYFNYNVYKSSREIDYLIIDEVQDLYPKTIKLLLSNAKYKVVFAGDTAQTIAKGVSSRISDMKEILKEKRILDTEAINLYHNYRSQNSILELANSVVKLIETIFPESIDKMIEEVSDKTGDKPFLIEPVGDELLCQFFFGKTTDQTAMLNQQNDFSIIEDDEAGNDGNQQVEGQPQQKIAGGRVITPHFGASQVIIVRD